MRAGGVLAVQWMERPFIGNEDFSNIPALAGLDKEITKNTSQISLEDSVQ